MQDLKVSQGVPVLEEPPQQAERGKPHVWDSCCPCGQGQGWEKGLLLEMPPLLEAGGRGGVRGWSMGILCGASAGRAAEPGAASIPGTGGTGRSPASNPHNRPLVSDV